jgi:hypothetical protein
VLRQGEREEGGVDGGGGPEARRLPPHPRPPLLAHSPQARRSLADSHIDPCVHDYSVLCLQSIDLRLTRGGAAPFAGLLRCGKSCRLRWTNYLRPDLKRGMLSDEEEKLVIDLHAEIGNRCVSVPHVVFPASFACAGGALFPTHTRSLIVDCFLAPPRPPRAGGPRSRRGSPGGRTTRSRTTGTRASGRSSSGWASTPSPTSHCSRSRRPLLLHHRPYNSRSTRSRPVHHNNIKSRNRRRRRTRR